VEGIGRAGVLPEPMKLSELAARVSEVFDIEHVRYYGDPEQMLVTCAILPGSGKGEVDLAVKSGADVYITGDINHHDGIDAVEKGIAVIDAGHYGVEKIFIPYMKEYLEREVPSVRIISCDGGMPFRET
jgi:putative NIF3 family GTP cyclohydrolase 1 type 2